MENINLWNLWLSETSDFNFKQLEVAKGLDIQFLGIPSAIKDSDQALCLNWVFDPWNISLEISLEGNSEWWAYNTQNKEYLWNFSGELCYQCRHPAHSCPLCSNNWCSLCFFGSWHHEMCRVIKK